MGLELTLLIYDSHSLKGKRRVVKSIVEGIQSKYKVSGAEVSEMDMLNKAVIGFGVVSNNRKLGQKTLQKIINEIDMNYEVEIIQSEWMEI